MRVERWTKVGLHRRVQFAGQEPGSNDEVARFIEEKGLGGVTIAQKTKVNGDGAHPLYAWLRAERPMWGAMLLGDSVRWNFGKFLLDKEGRIVESYLPQTPPFSIEADILRLIGSTEEAGASKADL
jgi:glutathione peroxidase